jgi:RNA polymerase-binding transcription factor DksA
MSDDADKTQDRIELEDALRRKEMKNIKYIQGTGFCLNCGEKLGDARRWCDKDCADDWDYHVNKRK